MFLNLFCHIKATLFVIVTIRVVSKTFCVYVNPFTTLTQRGKEYTGCSKIHVPVLTYLRVCVDIHQLTIVVSAHHQATDNSHNLTVNIVRLH